MTNITVDGEEFRNRKAQKCQHLKMQEKKKLVKSLETAKTVKKVPRFTKNCQKYQYSKSKHLKNISRQICQNPSIVQRARAK